MKNTWKINAVFGVVVLGSILGGCASVDVMKTSITNRMPEKEASIMPNQK